MRLYAIPFSTNVERATLALALEGLDLEHVVIDPGDRGHRVLHEGQPLDGHPAVAAWIRRPDALPRP